MRLGFRTWLAATTVSTLGDSVTFFALGWAAASFGPDVAGLVLTVGSVPLFLLVLVGGAVADRFGIRRTMIGCDLAMVAVMVVFALHAVGGVSVAGLCLLSFVSCTASALRRPAEGAFPRLFADGDALARTMATVSMAQQVARFGGAPVGGLVLAAGGLVTTASLDAVSFVLVAAALLAVRPPLETPVAAEPEPWARAVVGSMRTAARTQGVVALLLGVAAIAASVLPLVMLGVPLAGHARGWSAGETGLVAGCWIAGTLSVTALVAWRGDLGAAARVVGPAVGAAGVLLLALTTGVTAAVVSMVLVGVGTATWTTTAFPLFVRVTPPDMLARFQALLHLAQTGATLVAVPLLGLVAEAWGLAVALVAVAVVLLATAALPWRTDPEYRLGGRGCDGYDREDRQLKRG